MLRAVGTWYLISLPQSFASHVVEKKDVALVYI